MKSSRTEVFTRYAIGTNTSSEDTGNTGNERGSSQPSENNRFRVRPRRTKESL